MFELAQNLLCGALALVAVAGAAVGLYYWAQQVGAGGMEGDTSAESVGHSNDPSVRRAGRRSLMGMGVAVAGGFAARALYLDPGLLERLVRGFLTFGR